MYYLRTKSKTTALKGLGVDLSTIQNTKPVKQVEVPMAEFDPEEFAGKVCSLDNPDCEACSS
jgi:TATA-box binding protein (TBP) (component of TFIID and TFIIIB)